MYYLKNIKIYSSNQRKIEGSNVKKNLFVGCKLFN